MDLNKYIALYLVKNKYCSLPGLGTLQLNKQAAQRNSDNLEPPSYSISFQNVGSIDDQLPHFIGMQENISTNNASNALSVFAKEVKEEIAAGRPYILDGLGRFIGNNQKLEFHQVSDLDLGEFTQQIPTKANMDFANNTVETNQPALEELKINHQNNPKTPLSLGKIVVPILLIGAIGTAGYFGYNYIQNKKATDSTPAITEFTDTTEQTTLVEDSILNAKTQVAIDTSVSTIAVKSTDSVVTTPTDPIATGPAMKVVIQTYTNEAEANKRVATLVKLSKAASVLKIDSSTYHVVINLPSTSNTKDKVIDSLRRFYNPGGNVFEVR
jgi:nucleoid DNA-binding protein